jgi:hypothetical protein
MSDSENYPWRPNVPYSRDNPFQGTSGRALRPRYGDPETGQGSLELDVAGRGAFGDTGGRGPDGEITSDVHIFDSSRCQASKYHYVDNKVFMTWYNGKTPWIYHEVPVTVYQDLLSSSSAGRFINSTMNLFAHNKLFNGDQYSQFVYGVMPMEDLRN